MELGLGKVDYNSEPLTGQELLAVRSRQRLWWVEDSPMQRHAHIAG
jgi:hypothetical protein